ncbi:MAG: magnesium transporter, partial [Clostridia bacterium]|nr:magnesium transporter [Clostridia bacterium]
MLETVTELLEAKRFTQTREILCEMNPADIGELFNELDEKQFMLAFRLLPKELAAEVFVELDPDFQEQLIVGFSDNELREVLDELFLDDAVDLVEEMPANVVKRILSHTDPDTRKMINSILKYPKDSAGSLMTIEYVSLRTGMTVEDAFLRIRRTGIDKETIYTCYVTDDNRRLLGVVTVKALLLSEQDDIIDDIMEENVISALTNDDKESVAQKFSHYGLIALPVVDSENRLVGIVTFDDAIDVIEEEATEDIEKMAAITPGDKPYIKTGVFETWLRRIPWLLILMVSATFTGKIISSFEEALAAQVALTAFIPMLMDTGGNCGSQASVSVIRGLSLGEIKIGDILRVIWKEIRVAFLCGVVLGVATFGKIILIDGYDIPLALVVSITLVATVLIAKVVGCSLPILAKCARLDPAVMASPFITTIVDALALVIYFKIASSLLAL